MQKAVFYDRDGVITKMVYDRENGIIETVRNPSQIAFVPGIIDVLRHTTLLGYKNIIISNQPNIAIKKVSKESFEEVTQTILDNIKKQGAHIDAGYYCLHHPFAALEEYKKDCDCRKPKPGLILQAAKEHDIDLSKSWVIGDGVNDILAGHAAGCKTILLGNILESEYLRVLEEKLGEVKPNYLIKKLKEAIEIIKV